jgi:hypothetical protein
MKLTQLVAKPQLVKITIDDEDIVKQYGETLEFWVWDRQPIDKFIKLATMTSENFGDMVNAVNDMVLDELGNPIITSADQTLPTNVMTKVIGKVVETLGK